MDKKRSRSSLTSGLEATDMYDSSLSGGFTRKHSLRRIVAAAAGTIVAISVLSELLPMAVLWIRSVQSLSSTALDSLESEGQSFRSCVLSRTLEKVNTELYFPVQMGEILLGLNGLFPTGLLKNSTAKSLEYSFRPYFHDTGRMFPDLTVVGIGWVNDLGQHAILDKFMGKCCGMYDSETNPNVTWLQYNSDETALTTKLNDTTVNYNMIKRSWWSRSHNNAVNGMAWTGPYWSVSPGDGFVITFTKQIPDPANKTGPSVGVILIAYSVRHLVSYFSGIRHTPHGWAMLINWNMDMIAATDGFPTFNPTTKALYKAHNSPNETVRTVIAEWKEQCGSTSCNFTVGDLVVDITSLNQTGNLTVWLILVTPMKDYLSDVKEANVDAKNSAYLSVIILVVVEAVMMILAIVSAAIAGAYLVAPLLTISEKMKKIARMEFDTESESREAAEEESSSIREISMLQTEALRMSNALSSFSLYVPKTVVKYLIRNKLKPAVGVRRTHATVLFLDVVNFTQTMNDCGVQTVVGLLEVLFDSFSDILTRHGAIIDKYIGDAIMAIWGCPVPVKDSELLATKAVSALFKSLDEMNAEFKSEHQMTMGIRIGYHAGEVFAGNVGCSSRLNYTVLGDTVNLAARLEPINKDYGTNCCVSGAIRDACTSEFAFRCLGKSSVRGFSDSILIHELIGPLASLTPAQIQLQEDFREIDELLCQGVDPPMSLFDQYMKRNENDGVASAIMKKLYQ